MLIGGYQVQPFSASILPAIHTCTLNIVAVVFKMVRVSLIICTIEPYITFIFSFYIRSRIFN